jgi:hypothetical protein
VFARRLEQRPSSSGVILAVIDGKRGPLEERASALARRFRRPEKGVQQFGEIFDGFSPLEQPHQTLERLAELRIRVEGGQKLPRGPHLVGRALLHHAELVQQQRLVLRIGGAALFGSEVNRSR